MKKFLLIFICITTVSKAQNFVSAELIATDDTASMQLIYADASYEVNTYKITYTTKDINDSVTTATGALMVPVFPYCDYFPLISYNHGTVLVKEDVPSRNNFEADIAKLMASAGKVVCAPDYLGLGDNSGFHPYLHGESEATATIDLIRACREFIRDSLSISVNGEVFLTGYSQGGHAAMATAKYIQDNNLLTEFDVKAVGPASGPYNLSGIQSKLLLSDEPYSNPAYVLYLLFSYNTVYGDLFENYSDILKSPYDSLVPPFFDGTYNISTVNSFLPSRIGDFMQDSVLLNFKNDSADKQHPLWRALQVNDNHNWAPRFPVEMYYCTRDEQVNYHNSLDAEQAMQGKGADAVAVDMGTYSHFACIFPSLEGAIEFFESLETPCSGLSMEYFDDQDIIIYPNPAQNKISVKNFRGEGYFRIYDITGRMVKELTMHNQLPVSIADLKEGMYFLKGGNSKLQISRKMVVRR